MTGTLNIIGCGKVGRTLARLWADQDVFSIQDVANRSRASGQSAVSFIGAGHAVDPGAPLRPAAIWMIAATDDQIAPCCERIAATGHVAPGTIVFHCSGALSSSALKAAADCGAAAASVHPVASFAEPLGMLQRFAGTYSCIEGDAVAEEILAKAFARIGAKMLHIDAASKIIYHAGAVFASNYLVVLLDIAAQALVASGIPRATAFELTAPLALGSVVNAFKVGTVEALTGPVARGDVELVQLQYAALGAWNPAVAELYRQLARAAAKLAGRQLEI